LITYACTYQQLTEDHDPPYPSTRTLITPNDFRHVNSILVDGSKLRIICSNYGPSYLLTFENDQITERYNNIGNYSHDIFKDKDGNLWTCNSFGGKISRLDGSASIPLSGGFLRGALLSPNGNTYIGVSSLTTKRIGKPDTYSVAGIYKLSPDGTKTFINLPNIENLQVFDLIEVP
jgi:hypothetical protein